MPTPEAAPGSEANLALRALLGSWGMPPDGLAWAALGLAALLLLFVALGRGRALFDERLVPERAFLTVTAFAAALLSLAWIAVYLRGGPRIIDATSYFLQGRALAHGGFTWDLPGALPSASFRGRFLLFREGALGGIFPPGYPLLLALGALVRAPMIVGPLLGAAIVVTTYRLAEALAAEALASREDVATVARTAALASVFCAALRYHTADTMSHGATALGVALALTGALGQRPLLTGLALGYVAATRPVSALAVGAVSLALLLAAPRSGSSRARAPAWLAWLALGALPGALLLLASQRAVTGAWLGSTQRLYYALSDGPPGCFRWGFGDGVGCVSEHGDFVTARLEGGYGALAAAGTTLRRLKMHLRDVANLEPLWPLVLVPLARVKTRGVRAATALLGLHVLAYAPFYFDGNYPGGGARFFADLLPVEHALVALGVAALARASRARYARVPLALLASMLLGFAVHAAYDHGRLRDRDGGRPLFEPDVLARANAREGLVYVDTDAGFALGHAPGADGRSSVIVARKRGDDRDRLLFDALDRPPTWDYRLVADDAPGALPGAVTPVLVPWAPPELGAPLRFEAEAEWPPLAQAGGFAAPFHVDACASAGRALIVTPTTPGAPATVTIALPVPTAGPHTITLRIVRGARLPNTARLVSSGAPATLAATVGDLRWSYQEEEPWAPEAGDACVTLPPQTAQLEGPEARLTFEVTGAPLGIDAVMLGP